MGDSSKSKPWSSLKSVAPTVLMVILIVGFLNSRDPATAAFFGMAGLLAFVWSIRRAKRACKLPEDPGRLLLKLGNLTAVGSLKMSGWYKLAVVAFAFLGVANFFATEAASLPQRAGMAMICFAIVGAFLTLSNAKLRRYGAYVFSIGFILAGILFTYAMILSVNSGDEDGDLRAVKQAVLAALMFLSGVPGLLNLFRRRGITPIYDRGISGPHGFVPWAGAERIELVEHGQGPTLEVGAYGGWTLYVDVAEDQRDDVTALIERVTTE